jgi:hypothetical protein
VFRVKHRVVQVVPLVPDAELGAQAVVLGRGRKDLRLRDGERRKGELELRHLFGKLGGVVGGIYAGQWHGLKGGKPVFGKASSETAIKKYESPDSGEQERLEYTPVDHLAVEFGGKFL